MVAIKRLPHGAILKKDEKGNDCSSGCNTSFAAVDSGELDGGEMKKRNENPIQTLFKKRQTSLRVSVSGISR